MCGMVSIAPQRLMRLSINKNERNKLLKEMAMADVLASHGFRVHLVEEDPRTGTYDALINGLPADFKRTSSHNNIRKYAKKAIEKQNAKLIVLQLDNDTPQIHRELFVLIRKKIPIIYFFSDRTKDLYCYY